MMMFLLLCGCGVKEPTNEGLKDMIPDEVLSYEYGSTVYTSSISSIEIERSKINDSIYTADCICKLTDDISNRTVYITLIAEYWDNGGWQLSSWEPYRDEDIVFSVPFDEMFLCEKFQSLGYNFENFTQTELIQSDPENVDVVYSLYDEHSNLTAIGEIYANCSLVTEEGYPKIYYWDIIVDESMVSCIWDIYGTWRAISLPPFYEKFGLQLTIKEMSEERFWTDLRIPYYIVAGNVEHYDVAGNLMYQWDYPLDWLSGLDANYYNSNGSLLERNLQIEEIYRGGDYIAVSYYADTAYCAYIWNDGGTKRNQGWINLDKIR